MSATNHDYCLIDAKLEQMDKHQVIKKIEHLRPDVLGISSFTTDMSMVSELARAYKRLNPQGKVILGGAHPSALPIETLQSCESYDIVVIGGGERVLVEILDTLDQGLDLFQVNGIAFKQEGKIHETSPQEVMPDLDDLPPPAWRKMPASQLYYVEVSRGCPGRCSFCYNMYGRRIRCKSVARVLSELKDIQDYANPKEFILGAATFGIPKQHYNELLDGIIQSGLKIKWGSETRVDITDREFIIKMKNAGCHCIALGVESGNDDILRQTGKNITVVKIKECVNSIHELDIPTLGFFVFGHPNETKKTIKQTSDLAVELNTTSITIGIMTPWPGTKVYEMAHNGEGGYYLDQQISIEGQNKHFGRRALLFKNFPIWYLQWMKIRTYLLLYWKNRRFVDGAKFCSANFKEACLLMLEMFRGFLRSDR
ncbi:MAG: radical SAM protein [Deltaproteobacteria bacterium]|nr:radical SAM protein [Deltaproteobacteria bacterium]